MANDLDKGDISHDYKVIEVFEQRITDEVFLVWF